MAEQLDEEFDLTKAFSRLGDHVIKLHDKLEQMELETHAVTLATWKLLAESSPDPEEAVKELNKAV